MNNRSVFRVGGIAVFLAVLFSLAAMAMPILLAIGALCMAIFIFALYRLFSPENTGLSFLSGILGIGGALALAIATVMIGSQSGPITGTATWLAFFLPPLLFGYLGYRYPQAGISRTLAILGLVGGIFGLINFIVTMIAGGDWMNPNNPALIPLIMGSYYIGMLASLVWMVWSGIVLVRKQ